MNKRGFFGVGLHMPKTDANIGSALRACSCFGADFMAITGQRYQKHGTDTNKWHNHMPLHHTDDLFALLPYNCIPVAVDLLEGAGNIKTYVHPDRAFYIFGPEDGTLGEKITSRCRDKIYIPSRFCLNLAATVNVVLYDRKIKS